MIVHPDDGHEITTVTLWARQTGRGGRSFRQVSVRCSCGEWEDQFGSLDDPRRAEVVASARAHLDGAGVAR